MPYRSYVLDRRVTLAYTRNTGERDSFNQPITEDVTETTWAARRDVTASERISGQTDRLISTRNTRFIIRFRPDADATWTVEHDGLLFRVEGLREVNRRRYLELFCSAIEGG